MHHLAHSATRKLLRKLAREVQRAADMPDEEAVHDLRVAVRRASQSLRFFEDEFPTGAARKVRRRIRAIRDSAAPVRDRDVILTLLRQNRLPQSDAAIVFLQGERSMAARTLQAGMLRLTERDVFSKWFHRLGLHS